METVLEHAKIIVIPSTERDMSKFFPGAVNACAYPGHYGRPVKTIPFGSVKMSTETVTLDDDRVSSGKVTWFKVEEDTWVPGDFVEYAK